MKIGYMLSLTTISDFTFAVCSSLTSLDLSNITKIGDNVFMDVLN